MRTERIVRHQLVRDLSGKCRIKAATDIDRRQFLAFARIVSLEFLAFTLDIGLLRVGLRVHRDIFSGSHRHRTGRKPRNSGEQHVAATCMRRCDAKNEACRGYNAVVRAQNGSAEPANACGAMPFSMAFNHTSKGLVKVARAPASLRLP